MNPNIKSRRSGDTASKSRRSGDTASKSRRSGDTASTSIRILRLSLASLAIALSLSAQAQNRPVRLSINNSSTVAFQANAGAAANDLSMAYFAGDVVGQANRRVMQLRVADPVLCADFTTGQSDSTVRLRLVDANQMFIDGGDGRGFRGLVPLVSETGGIRLNMDPADSNRRILNIATQASLKCSVFPGGILPAVQPTVSSKAAPEGGDLIFANGFETSLTPGVELVTTINTLPSARAGDAVVYTIRVRNEGTGTANNVQVRDFFKKPVAGSANPGLLDGNWTCTGEGSASCGQPSAGTTNAGGYIFQSGATLPSGTALRFNVSRVLSNATPPTPLTTFLVQAAAFSQPGDSEINQVNNAAVSRPIQVVTNVAPTIGGLLTRTIDEDTGTGALAFTVNDPDNTGPLNVTASVRGDPHPLISQSGILLGETDLNNRTIRLTPNANASGFANIDIMVSDGISSRTEGFSLVVNAVNDAPAFTFSPDCPTALGMQFTPENGATPAIMTFPVGTKGNFVCSAALLVDFGPFESLQTVSSIADLQVVESANILLGTGTNAVNLQTNGTTASLGFGLLGNSGSAEIRFRVRDSGGIASNGIDLSPLKTLRIRVPSAAPTMSAIAAQSSAEDVPVGPINFTVNDTDTPLASLVLTSSSSNNSLIDSAGIVFGGSGSSRTMLLTPKLDQFGSATIAINLTDGDEIVSQTFVYTVTSVNDDPSYTSPASLFLPTPTANPLTRSVLFATNMSAGGGSDELSQTLTWLPVSPQRDANQNIVGSGNILQNNAAIIVTSSAPTTSATLNFSLRATGVAGYICLIVDLADNGTPVGFAATKVVRVVVGPDQASYQCAPLRQAGK